MIDGALRKYLIIRKEAVMAQIMSAHRDGNLSEMRANCLMGIFCELDNFEAEYMRWLETAAEAQRQKNNLQKITST